MKCVSGVERKGTTPRIAWKKTIANAKLASVESINKEIALRFATNVEELAISQAYSVNTSGVSRK